MKRHRRQCCSDSRYDECHDTYLSTHTAHNPNECRNIMCWKTSSSSRSLLIVAVLLYTRLDPALAFAATPSRAARSTGAGRGRGGRGGGGGRGGAGRTGTPSRSKTWHSLRKSGVKTKNRTKAPRWEKEGDSLYHAVVAQADGGGAGAYGSVGKASTMEEAREMLSRLARRSEQQQQGKDDAAETSPSKQSSAAESKEPSTQPAASIGTSGSRKKEKKKSAPPPHMAWGPLPVGPVLRKSLLDASLTEPTAVQTAAFPVLASGQNAILASPTGTGKSLAFLLPLLASSKGRNVPMSIMIATPTVELAKQLQREVDKLWPPIEDEASGEVQSAMHVVGFVSGNDDDTDSDSDESEDQGSKKSGRPDLLPQLKGGSAPPILAGTPRSLRALLGEMMTVLRDRDGDRELKAISNELRRNLKAVVFDEADRLLRTEVKARDAVLARQLRESGETASFTQKKKRSIKRTKPQAEQLLSDIPVPLDRLQVVCASATVGRTLRRQLMDLLQTPSLDKTAVLITAEGDVRTGKDVEKRKASLLPDTLRHRYRLLPDIDKSSPDNGLADSVAALHETMQSLDPPAPALVFPGKLGVEAVRNALVECGLKCVLGLKDVHLSKEGATKSWESTQIFVIDNQFGRGLDVLGVRYVFLLSPPSSAAGYTHLSGRTGRNGKEGTAITFTRPRETHKLVAIADAVGLSFEDIAGGSTADAKQASTLSSAGSKESNPWTSLSESALKRKTVTELKDYLATQGVVLNESSRILKADLLDAIDKLPKRTDR